MATEDDYRDDDEEEAPVKLDGRAVVMTPSGVTFLLNDEDQAQARKCLERSGKVTINFGEISVSSLNEVRRLSRFGTLKPDGGVPAPSPAPGPID